MGLKETATHRAALALCRKFPDAPARTLARKLHDENPALFPNLDLARSAVRRVFGVVGERHRKQPHAKLKREPRKAGAVPPLPESCEANWEPHQIDARRVLVLADLHLPFHSVSAIDAALAYGARFDPDHILLNGDVFDFYGISRFDKEPGKPKIADELRCGREFFAHLRHRFPKSDITFRYGNHDRRWDKYLTLNAAVLLDDHDLRDDILTIWHKRAGITENGVRVVREQKPVMLGKLPVFHGDELPRGMASPVNPARGAFLRALASLLHSHLHRTSEHTERTMDGRTITCRTTGALCGLHPEYARINKWDSGFATVEVGSDGNYECELKKIIDKRVY